MYIEIINNFDHPSIVILRTKLAIYIFMTRNDHHFSVNFPQISTYFQIYKIFGHHNSSILRKKLERQILLINKYYDLMRNYQHYSVTFKKISYVLKFMKFLFHHSNVILGKKLEIYIFTRRNDHHYIVTLTLISCYFDFFNNWP